ncbi:MAG: Mrr restriction system protein [Bacteroidia bacterium]|nr:Mrr restriction system protein [Bacteroidia bacterium]
MSKSKSPSASRTLANKVILAAFEILKANGGSLRITELIDKIKTTVKFDAWDTELYEKTNYVRWISILHFYSIDCVKAGFLYKKKGVWTLTPEGEALIPLGGNALLDKAVQAYRAWKRQQRVEGAEIEVETEVAVAEESFEHQQKALLEQVAEQASKGLEDYINGKTWNEFQDLVAALLAGMGYHIAHVAPKGRDGGIDIIAYTDPLGVKPPRIIVQVKHKPEKSISSDDIQRLIGTMKRDSDVGIFVTSGDFSQPAKMEARSSGKHVELIDFDRLINLWTEYYPKMNDEQKSYLPLQAIYFLGSTE